MKTSMLATTVTFLFLATLAVAQEKPTPPAPSEPAPAPSACADLLKQLRDLENRADEVCEKDDAESRKQCEALDQELEQLDEKIAGANCEDEDQGRDDQGEEDGDDEGDDQDGDQDGEEEDHPARRR